MSEINYNFTLQFHIANQHDQYTIAATSIKVSEETFEPTEYSHNSKSIL